MDEKKRNKIKEEAGDILKKFASALGKVKIKEKKIKKGAGGYRKEGEGLECSPEFRKGMFENAPNKEGDCIVAEKKNW